MHRSKNAAPVWLAGISMMTKMIGGLAVHLLTVFIAFFGFWRSCRTHKFAASGPEHAAAAYCKMVASLMPKDVNLGTADSQQWLEALTNFNDIARAHRATLVKSEDGH